MATQTTDPGFAALDLVAFAAIFPGLIYAMGAVATRAWCNGKSALALRSGFFGAWVLWGQAVQPPRLAGRAFVAAQRRTIALGTADPVHAGRTS